MVRPHNVALQATGPRFGSMASFVLAGVWGSPRKSGSSLALRTACAPWLRVLENPTEGQTLCSAVGTISNERVIWDTAADPSSPDGMTIDSEGRLWIAFCHGAKVVCFDPATRKIEEQIDFPCVETTACAFGGPELRDLYITTGMKPGHEEPLAGRLFVCRPGAQGVPASAFAG